MNEEIFPLDDAAISSVTELNEQIKTAEIAKNAILMYFCRVHKLVGKVRLAENNRELIIQRTGENDATTASPTSTTAAGN